MEDGKIIELFWSRDEAAIFLAKEKYGTLLLNISKRILGSGSDAEECVNDALLKLWQTVPPVRPNNLRAYICKIVRNESLKRLSYNLAEKRSTDSEVSLDGIEAVLPDGAARDALERVDLAILLNDFLKTLSPEARAVFVRRYFFFDSIEDIAADLGLGKSNVKTTLWRTRARLKSFFERSGMQL